jgi:thymidylate synthase (FAD)
MTQERRVLDKGYIRLVDFMGSDLSIVRSARVSYDALWRTGINEKSDAKLIAYLWKNGHTTPFEAVTMTFEVKAPIFVYRQWHRHRTQSYNEMSARYTELPKEWYTPTVETIGKQSKVNKQARDIVPMTEDEECARRSQIYDYNIFCERAYLQYQCQIAQGWPRELARMCLPLSMYSKMFCTMNLLNCMKFLRLRLHEHAQYEIRAYAVAMVELVEPLVPVAMAAFEESL